MGLFNQHQDTPRIDYQGHQYTLAAFIDKFNAVAAQLAQARRQLTALRKQERDTARPLQDENSQLKQQVAQLKEQLGQAQQVEVDGEMLPIAELVQRYRQLVAQSSPAKQPADQQRTALVRSVKPSSALIDRYYELVQAVLAEYQGKVARLQDDAHSRAMFSLNLPYQYGDDEENSNQVDGVVVNEKGIFVLEIKNYTANKLWINPDGYAVTEKTDGQQKVYKDRRGRGIVAQGTDHRAAVLQALKSDGEVYRHFRYLSKQVHILYVSTDPNTTIVTTGAGGGSDHRFVSLDKLRTVIDGASGQLRPDIIQAVAAAISNQQKGEKQFKYKCFPADPDRQVSQAWQQYAVMQALLQLNLDDLVAQRDPKILVALGQAGLRTCNGFVTSKPHQRKK